MPQRIDFCPAHILVSRPYRETSALLEVFTLDHGRLGIIARGASGPRAKRRGILQPFAPLLLAWTESGELGSLTGVEPDGPSVDLAGERIFHGWYVNELLMKLTQRHDPHPALYQAYAATLPALAQSPDEASAEAVLREFELTLLAELGYGIELTRDLTDHLRYRHDAAEGVIQADYAGFDTYAGAALIALRDGTLGQATSALRRDARKLLRSAIARQLSGRELETPKLLRAMRARMTAAPDI